MLCQFTVKNFKSIRDEVTLDMQASSISEHTDKIIKLGGKDNLLPVAVIYGPNGGGKSNVLKALHALIARVELPILAIGLGKKVNGGYHIGPFAFSKETVQSPTEFELFFRTKLAEYRYQLDVKGNYIQHERLDRMKLETKRRSFLFERDENKIVLKGDLAKLKVSTDLSSEMPLLSYLGITFGNNEIIKDVINWFLLKTSIFDYGNPSHEQTAFVPSTEEEKGKIIKLIEGMGLDIIDFRMEAEGNKIIDVFTKHVVDNCKFELNLKDESSGTIKIFGMSPLIIDSLNNGKTLIIDELDAKLHPLLLRYVIELFTSMEINKHGAQLIFTSHDLSTMNADVFRRDEIWFVAKGEEQNSKLYSLVEFKTKKGKRARKDARYDKQYLESKYGADPYLNKINQLGEIDCGF